MGKLDGKVAIITGAASGQGAAEARAFVREGARTIVADISGSGLAVADECGENARFIKHDVSDADSWKSLVAYTISEFGGIDILVNNAAIYRPVALQDTDTELMYEVFSVNQLGAYLGMKHVIEPMKARGGGSIINISSGAGTRSAPGMFAYSTSKWAIRGMTKAASVDLAPYNIRVNTVVPGAIDTPILALNPPELNEWFLEAIPMHRYGRSEELVGAVLLLASDDASYMTGSEITVCGGILA